MNKKLVAIGVVVLLLLAGGYYFLSAKKTSNPISVINQTGSSPKSLKDLLGLGTSQKCTFSTTSDNDTSSGTVYTASGKMRGDFTSTVSGKSTVSHMIIDGTTSYTWMDGQTTGYKMTYNPNPATPAPAGSAAVSESSQASQGPDLNQETNYSCSGWVADASFFALPSGVNFISFESLIPTMKPGAEKTSGSASQCSYCDNLTGDSKTQCKAALNCP